MAGLIRRCFAIFRLEFPNLTYREMVLFMAVFFFLLPFITAGPAKFHVSVTLVCTIVYIGGAFSLLRWLGRSRGQIDPALWYKRASYVWKSFGVVSVIVFILIHETCANSIVENIRPWVSDPYASRVSAIAAFLLTIIVAIPSTFAAKRAFDFWLGTWPEDERSGSTEAKGQN